jgi:shikimate kinase
MNLILFGFKGAGKTHFGKLLAQQIHRPFIDTDDLVSALYAKPVRKLYQELGETLFRALETQAILSLQSISNSIIALGGGAVLDADNLALLQKIGQLVYLDASFETIRSRVQEEPAFITTNTLQSIYAERKPLYDSIPARRISVDQLDEAGVLAALRSIAYLEDLPNGF